MLCSCLSMNILSISVSNSQDHEFEFLLFVYNLERIENASDMIVISSASQLGRICLGGNSSRNLLECPDRLMSFLNWPCPASGRYCDRA